MHLGRGRNVIVHRTLEPYLRKGKQRERWVWDHVVNLVRAVGMAKRLAIKWALSLGRWKEGREYVKRDPQPKVVDLASGQALGGG